MLQGRASPLLAAGLILCCGAAQPMPVNPGEGVRFQQQDHVLPSGTVPATPIGTVEIDTVRLRQAKGQALGFINVATAAGWVVRNVPVLPEDFYVYSKISVDFDLGVGSGTAVGTLNAAVEYSGNVLSSFSGAMAAHPVQRVTIATGGKGAPPAAPPQPPDLTAISFGMAPQPGDDVVVQLDHPNIEAATNQCYPMSVANSLQYLEDTKGLQVPHDHKPGLRPSASTGDTSLVGQVEQAMNRPVTSRLAGSGVNDLPGLQGKLLYLAQNNLGGRVSVTHWGPNIAGDVSMTANGNTVKSTSLGANLNFDTVLDAMREGQNCEAGFSYRTAAGAAAGGHMVDLVAAGKTRGQPWIMHSSDINQASDTAGAGPAGSKFDYLGAQTALGLPVSGTKSTLDVVICEKALPPPATTVVTETIDPAGHLCCVPPPPATVSINGKDGQMTMSGSASWLPMTGTIAANGAFDLRSQRTVAGFANVTSRFTGSAANGVYAGTIVVGEGHQLPTGAPITWRVQLTDPLASQLRPVVRVNGYRRSVGIGTDDAVKVSIAMQAGREAGKPGDWWLVAMAGGAFYSYDLATQAWQPGLTATYTGPLMAIPYFGLPTLAGLPAGSYTFYFGFDALANGSLDIGSTVYDTAVLDVR